jgi:heptosyltransferase-1
MNILIVKPSSLGDIVHTLPVVGMIREQFPDSVISWVVNDSYAELLDLCPDIDTRIVFKRKRLARPRHWLEIFSFIRELRSQKFDIAIDFQGLFRSAVIARLSGAKKRVGFRNAREGAPWFYTDRVLLPANLKHAQDKNMFLARAALHLPDTEPTTALASSEVDAGKLRKIMREHEIDPDHPVLAVAPAARWGTKSWPPEFFAQVLTEVHKQTSASPPTLVCVGTTDERPVGDSIRAQAKCPVVNLMGETDLGALAELLRNSAVLLTNDSGPMHLAAAVGTPVVALFGATDPSLTGPYGDCHTVFRGECEHAPCMQRKCKINHSPECHGTINAAKVVEALKKHLDTPEPETKIEDMLAS